MRRTLIWTGLMAILLVAVSTTSYAAGRYVITSTKQVKNGSLAVADLSKGARTQLHGARGAEGPSGPRGVAGEPGPSHSYSAALDTQTAIPAGTSLTISTGAVPAGSYVVTARLQGQTGTDPSPGNNYRFDCSLSGNGATFDSVQYRVGTEASVERYLTFEGAGTTTASGPISLTCAAGNGHDLVAISGRVDAIMVGAIN